MPENSPEALSCNGVTCFLKMHQKICGLVHITVFQKYIQMDSLHDYTVQNHKGLKNNFITHICPRYKR
jgi:type III secretory pathway component EscU